MGVQRQQAESRVSVAASPARGLPAVDVLQTIFAKEMQDVDGLLLTHTQSKVPLMLQVARHLLTAGGKRLRPLLTLASARLCGSEGQTVCKLAAAIEFVHSATLLHDDVVDAEEKRRDRPAAQQLWGNTASILAGDFLLSCALDLMVDARNLDILRLMANTSALLAEGEALQLGLRRKLSHHEALCRQVIESKTASLFSAACQVGALLAGLQSRVGCLKRYGFFLGMAFQMRDDLLDYFAPHLLHKKGGRDFQDGHVTLPVLLAFRRADKEGKVFWCRTIEQSIQKADDLEIAKKLLVRSGAVEEVRRRARNASRQAIDALQDFPSSFLRDTLTDLALSCAP